VAVCSSFGSAVHLALWDMGPSAHVGNAVSYFTLWLELALMCALRGLALHAVVAAFRLSESMFH
jgi:hypothetical protein